MVEGAPDTRVVEILSTDRSRDLVRKRQLYAEAGVKEYWIFRRVTHARFPAGPLRQLQPRSDTTTLLDLRGGEYVERAVLDANPAATLLLPGHTDHSVASTGLVIRNRPTSKLASARADVRPVSLSRDSQPP